ncbi:transcription-repair coupling factor [Candidatus Neomicrothrix sp.]|uniref:transcription-repair coupling factor n=1 Tax=Candidatus Neomicrothrix sp. TaxID=2719034 RepID=UPI0025963931|nr:transcription-repair coupling factor [Candidatus Microthrix sp.]HMS48412.1 transcription-repair coupling factor [Candidatus Microthrix sp.]
MPLTALASLLRDDPALRDALGRDAATVAVPEAGRASYIAAVAETSSRSPIVVAVPTVAEAETLADDLGTWLGPDAVEWFPAWETLPFERVSPSTETMGRRMRVMWRLADPARSPRVIVAPIRALLQRLGPHVEDTEPVIVGAGDTIDSTQLVDELVGWGYRREYQVEHRGEVAVRGSIVDVFPATAQAPVRIDLWGDEVERLTEFSVNDQRSVATIAEVEIHPAREVLVTAEVAGRARKLIASEPWGAEQWQRLADGETFDGMESWLPWLTDSEHVLFDLLDGDAQVMLVEPKRLADRASDLLAEEADLADALARTWGTDGAALRRLHLHFDRLLAHTAAPAWSLTATASGPSVPVLETHLWPAAVGGGDALTARLSSLLVDGYRVVVAVQGSGSLERIDALLGDAGLTLGRHDDVGDPEGAGLTTPGGHLTVAPLHHGFIAPSARLAVLSEADLTGRRRTHRKPKQRKASQDAQAFFADLAPGSYVVHHHHGVARYGGMVTRTLPGPNGTSVDRDYLLLEYRGADKLYVPSDQIDAVRQYTGGSSPTLSRMGGSDFARAKAKVRSQVAEVAQELVVLYQKRTQTEGHAYPPDTPWQTELEDSFEFTETPDQDRAIDEVKADMESERPMDRLVCGDVGFGKTEIALRAVFKAVMDGRQAAVLVPTTLLASQHFTTFTERFADYPVRVEVLSRFLTSAQARRVLAALAAGEVDVVIGTHRLLGADVSIPKLGLLVVDEEQRFGVSHKERIKEMSVGVDVLTLSATPIPRTLEMSLTGIRDLSLLHTPPAERQPILTYVGEFDDAPVAEAIRRELLREGQVFYVHNRVEDIDRRASQLAELVPEARIAVAHGQMDEGTLEQVMLDFWEGAYDVLVCTTIIESGIDMPLVNTLVVERADLLGLGQLHQIRGRVGRSGQRAYAYLFYPPNRELTEEAYERLKTIGESTELGSGFRIAMRDLEIRGAGNLLGTGQSGHIAAVGYDLYVEMVTQAIAELSGEPVRIPAEIKLDLPVDAHLPDDYVAQEDLRIEAYRRLATVTTQAEVDDITAEWIDRFGAIPDPARALLAVARVRAECARIGITECTATRNPDFDGPPLRAVLAPVELSASAEMRLGRVFPGAVYKSTPAATSTPGMGGAQLQVPVRSGLELTEDLRTLFAHLWPADGSDPPPLPNAPATRGRTGVIGSRPSAPAGRRPAPSPQDPAAIAEANERAARVAARRARRTGR